MSNTSNNIVAFPKKSTNAKDIQNLEEIQHNMDMMRHYHIQETILNLAPIIFTHLDIAGFGLDEELDSDVKDGAFIIEALRSLLCKSYGIYHPIQQITDNVFVQEDVDGEQMYKFAHKINLKFEDCEFLSKGTKK